MANSRLQVVHHAPEVRLDHWDSAHPDPAIVSSMRVAGRYGWCIVRGGAAACLAQRHTSLLRAMKAFFALSEAEKASVRVEDGGVRWRGWMRLGGESSRGKKDLKESLYLGNEHADAHPKVQACVPLHGKNRFPDALAPEHRDAILGYIAEGTHTGQVIMSVISEALGLGSSYMQEVHCWEPLSLVRLVRYPPPTPAYAVAATTESPAWGIGEHSDYGFLTLLFADSPGLQFLHPRLGWVEAPVLPADGILVNFGDMLDRMTGGRFVSRRHRVLNTNSRDRFSVPFFWDAAWDCPIRELPIPPHRCPPNHLEDHQARWATTKFKRLTGHYSDYLAVKVQKVFPELLRAVHFDAVQAPSSRFNLQNYVRTITELLADTTRFTLFESPPIAPPVAAKPGVLTLEAEHAQSLELVKDKAKKIFQLMQEADALMMCLPTRLESVDEQLAQIRQLEEENQLQGRRLEKAKEEAEECKAQLSAVIMAATNAQFESLRPTSTVAASASGHTSASGAQEQPAPPTT